MAQCDKKVALTSSKTQHLDAQGNVSGVDEKKTIVEFNKSDINVTVSGDNGEHSLTGKVNSTECNWKRPFKDGETKLMVTLSNANDETRHFNMVLTGKDGKVTLTVLNKDEPGDILRLDIEKFEEKK